VLQLISYKAGMWELFTIISRINCRVSRPSRHKLQILYFNEICNQLHMLFYIQQDSSNGNVDQGHITWLRGPHLPRACWYKRWNV